ncbi:hypothetical protein M378DRAFT_1052136 [Amanita muscaria Koide BX008]|uniref:Uncharacterized protein n=1 Tax=Amanita muscaria (strain Koide BX008) TaxID=946122 RepID=A0A0C2WDP0_AMAMK|nr:hypothetical protein M378DRAFT_1052136 [Amanita muscaria Koide BX008]
MKGIYKDYFPVVWNAHLLESNKQLPYAGNYVLTATYKNQLVFVKPQVDNVTLTFPETWVDINVRAAMHVLILSKSLFIAPAQTPTGGAGDKYIKAINQTPTPQTIGVGILPHILLVFNETGYAALLLQSDCSGHNVTAEFTPTLSAYIAEGYQENSVLRGAIATPAVWKRDLAALPETSNWKLERHGDPDSRQYSITAA